MPLTSIDDKIINDTRDQIFTVKPDRDINPEGFVVITPEPLAEHYNHCFRAELDAWEWLVQSREDHVNGKAWGINQDDKARGAQVLYSALSDIPVNDNDEIECDFLHFPSGTTNTDIWHWLESYFDVSIATDLVGN